MDSEYNYYKMTCAIRAALRAEKIIVCNLDKLFPKEDGLYPGCGAMASSILFCSGRSPDIILGKPSTYMMEYVAKKYGYGADEMIVVGDSLNSDIAMAKAYGSPYALIGVGESPSFNSLIEFVESGLL